ncbi:hypothetical protein [Glycomyces paridis]|uniref:Uncharacterized protein n=1 Tax=Glycomyces paridis TaxID=2126555 RepID=A0A4S8PGA9_9ACTN|nr:hypothetical protein [Glycomyces paridis]THV27324.1 hypothetical protein E9998_15850 [Glycomyces paridis]
MTRPKRPSLAERYADAGPAERERLSRNDTTARTEPPAARRPPATVWITRPILHSRGWTDAAIRDFLPGSEHSYSNPHVKGRSRMRLWSADTVARAESTDAWRRRLEASLTRRGVTLRELAASRDPAFLRRATAADAAINARRRRAT